MKMNERPTGVTVIAILCFVFSGFGLLALLCGAGSLVFLRSIAPNLPPAPGGGKNPMEGMIEMYDTIPGFWAWVTYSLVSGPIMAIILLIAGLGLMKMRPWSRWLCLGYCIYAILMAMVTLYYQLVFINPAMLAYQEEMSQQTGAPNFGSPEFSNVVTIGSVVLSLIFPIAVLIVLFRPKVAAAFAGRPVMEERTDERDLGYESDDGGELQRPSDERWGD
jgi:hypothetical protein